MKRVICFLVLVVSWFNVTAQDPGMAGELSKYWFYRWRLRNDFMVMGTEPGQSMIIDTRNPEARPMVKWGDVTILHGYYLTMLAIEHRILLDLERYDDLKNNERELYYAIKAYERLDYNSETFYSSNTDQNESGAYNVNDTPLPGCINGYVYRDDVPPTFISENPSNTQLNSPTTNYNKLNNGKTGIQYGPMFYNTGDYEDLWKPCQDDEHPLSNYLVAPNLNEPHLPLVDHKQGKTDGCFGLGEESQDQMIRLLLGFQTIVWSISDEIRGIDLDKDGINDVSMNFLLEAKRHATNLIGRAAGFLKGTFQFNEYNTQYWPAESNFAADPYWSIRGPRHKNTSIGWAVSLYMPPMQKVSRLLFTDQNDLELSSQFYAKAGIGMYESQLYTSLWGSGLFAYGSSVNSKMTILLNVLSNSGNQSPHSMGRHIYEKSKGTPGNKDKHFEWHPLYVPLYDYLWGWNPNLQANKDRKDGCYDYAKIMLSKAPCIGPYNFSYQGASSVNSNQLEADCFPEYWSSPMLWDNTIDSWSNLYSTEHATEGFFNGVDYMMLYNLVYANLEEEKPLYHDLINRIIDYPINTNSYTDLIEYSGTGFLFGAFEDMKVRSSLSGSQQVELKALDFVQLDPGSSILPSGNGVFSIYTDAITCNSIGATDNTTPYGMNQCNTCGLEQSIGASLAPTINKQIKSIGNQSLSDINAHMYFDQNEKQQHKSVVFPNPTNDKFVINSVLKIINVILVNSQGQELVSFDRNNSEYSIAEYASGIYWLKIIYENNEHDIIKIIRN